MCFIFNYTNLIWVWYTGWRECKRCVNITGKIFAW